ncbi:MAG: hypothetical protein ACHQRJ_12925 [Alphaproteobacteria bacterium]
MTTLHTSTPRPRRIKFMKISEVSVVDHAANEHCNFVLSKSASSVEQHRRPAPFDNDGAPCALSGSDVPGAEDTRTDTEKVEDMEAIVAEAIAHPPSRAERLDQWADRLFGEVGADQLHGAECNALRALYSACRQHGSMMKGASACALDNMAAAMLDEEPAKYQTFAKAYSAACRTPEGERWYQGMHGRLIDGHTPVDFALIRLAKADQDMEATEPTDGTDDSDAEEVEEARQALEDKAAELRRQTPSLSDAKLYLMSCQALPEAYKVIRAHAHGRPALAERA